LAQTRLGRFTQITLAGLALMSGSTLAPAFADEPVVQPKIVVQVGHQAPVQAAAWANGGRSLATLARDGSIVIWDVATQNIVNHAQLPVNWNDLGLTECIKLHDFSIDEAAGTLAVSFGLDLEDTHVAVRNSQGQGDGIILITLQSQLCRGIVQSADWYSYTYDLGSMTLTSGGPSEVPAEIPQRSFEVLARRDEDGNNVMRGFSYAIPPSEPPVWLPRSPDGSLWLEPNYDDGKRGDFNRRDEHLQFNQSTCASLTKCRYGVNILSGEGRGQIVASLTGNPRSYFLDADLSKDGRRLVRVEGLRNDTQARIEVLELAEARSREALEVKRAYHEVRWLGSERYALFSEGYKATDDTDDAMEGFPPALIVGNDCARLGGCPSVPPFAGMEPVDDAGGFLGIFSLASCYRGRREFTVTEPFCPDGRELPPSDISDARFILPPEFPTRLSKVVAPSAASGAQWELARAPAFAAGQEITAIKLSPDRTKLAVAVRDNPSVGDSIEGYVDDSPATQVDAIYLYDYSAIEGPTNGRKVISFSEELYRGYLGLRNLSIDQDVVYMSGLSQAGGVFQMDFSSDSRKLVFAKAHYQRPQDGRLFALDVDRETEAMVSSARDYSNRGDVADIIRMALQITGSDITSIPDFAARNVIAVGNDRAFGIENRQLVDLASGRVIASSVNEAPLVRAGYIPANDLLWAASTDGAIHFWDASIGARALTLYIFPDNRFFAVTPEGRYDTNLGPDSNLIRWVVPDAPWQSLASQTFMRDFYEPGLYRKLLDCRAARNCNQVFQPLPSFASLNRVLPKVAITQVVPGDSPAEAVVTVSVTEGVDPAAANGKTRSGIHNPRLFLDNKLVAYAADNEGRTSRDRQSSRGRGGNTGTEQVFEFRVPLATAPGSERMEFSAYAFNEDRIKSETASVAYQRPEAQPRARRAFVINIGIDRYDSEQFASLSFAGNDAELLSRRLAAIPGYEMRQVMIGEARGADGVLLPVSRQAVLDTLSLLVSDRGRAKRLRQLEAAGIDASQLGVATPDDIVIISYSGHGWAAPGGDFFLIPSDVDWDFASSTLRHGSAISTADLTGILELVQAGEISLIIDACHSAASVDSGEFKPGPMGDSGLGQLAYDKGIRILAAAQADDLALEDSRLQQGLLTYALAAEGLTEEGGLSDGNGDGEIRLDEWFAYAVDRLPQLSEDVGRGNFRGIKFSNRNRAEREVKVQRPSLFDFNPAPSAIILRSRSVPANGGN